jgi:type I protein arginine methyltransferase
MATPIVEQRTPSSSGSETSDVLNLKGDDGWEDIEPEDEQQKIISLLDHEVFPDVASMLAHCKEKYSFDFLKIRDNFALDFYGCIRLVNYIRSEIQSGRSVSSNISYSDFEAEEYLKPVMEDDALLFNLDDLPEPVYEHKTANTDSNATDGIKLLTRIAELEDELQKTQSQFSNYRSKVIKTLDERWKDQPLGPDSNTPKGVGKEVKSDDDSYYFSSYSYNGMFMNHFLQKQLSSDLLRHP